MRLSVTVHAAGRDADVYVDTDPDATVGQLRDELARSTGARGDALFADGVRLDDATTIGACGLHEGAAVSFAPQPPRFVPPTRGWALTVVGGRDSGAVIDLPIGDHEIGRNGPFHLSDASVSRRHALLRVTPAGATVVDLGSANGTSVDGQKAPVEATPGVTSEPPIPVGLGQIIALGDTHLVIAAATQPDAALEDGPEGVREFNRPPRMLPSQRTVRVVNPREPTGRRGRKIPLIGIAIPLVMGAVMFFVFHQALYLLFMLMSPVMAIGNSVSDKRGAAKDLKRETAEYVEKSAVARQQLFDGLVAETARRRNDHPDAVEVLRAATLPTRRLWERRRIDADFLEIRVGTADQESHLQVFEGVAGSAEDADRRTVFAAPAVLGLRQAGVVGIAGPEADTRGLVRWLLTQLCVLHAPRDLTLTLLAPKTERAWEWVRWLPQARYGDIDGPVASIGNDPETVTARVNEMTQLIKLRRDAAKSGRFDRSSFPAHVAVLDGARALRAVPGLAQVLQDGPELGVFAICLETADRLLPEECTASLVFDPEDPARLEVRRSGHDPLRKVLVEEVGVEYAETVARALAPVRDVSHDEEDSSLPDSARLLDVVSMEPPTVDAVRAHWQLGGKTTRMPLGVGNDGQFALDLRKDGPHGLIAGTTGSGKSELLQTIVASLAIANRPDSMNFVLVDYKGGSAFKDCVALPHTVGMVTDLDAHLVERALTSLGAELKRREHQLAEFAVKDIEDYDDLAAREPGMPPLPRLLIVIDEFASMARELPDFVTGLVNVAQRGRSLGIHLLLATQRPSGVVSAEIRANTNLRISLRVTDAADSQDVLEANDAARIPKSAPGRGFARLGAGALIPFQSGRVGGRRPGVKATHTVAPFVSELGWGQLGYAAPLPPRTETKDDVELTDLSELVKAIREAAQQEGLAQQRTPWLAALPDSLLLQTLPSDADDRGVLAPIPFGLEDLPELQQQRPAALDLRTDGHLLAAGSPRSGRSQLLRTVAASAAAHHSTADLHLFGIDCGNGALLPLAELPHCGAIVSRTQTERVARLLARLAGELERRQGLLAEKGFADISEQRRASAPEDRLPHLMLLLDRWEGFTGTLGELDGGKLQDQILTILREGQSAGVHAVIVGDRSLASGRISMLTENKITFRLADRGDYNLMGLNARHLPEEIQSGRAFRAETAVELQVALLADDPSGQGQAAAIASLAARCKQRDAEVPRALRPFRVDVLPSRISFDDAWAMRPADLPPAYAMIGVGGDELSAVGSDLVGTPSFIVAGPNRSGRSSALVTMARSLLAGGTQLAIFAPRPSPLRSFAGQPGVLAVVEDPVTPAADWEEIFDKAGDDPLVVVIDDGEVLRDTPGGELFRAVIKGLTGAPRGLVLGGNADGLCTGLSGWQVEAKKARTGALLSPQGIGDGDLLGVRVPRSLMGGPITPGRAIVHLGSGTVSQVAVPYVT